MDLGLITRQQVGLCREWKINMCWKNDSLRVMTLPAHLPLSVMPKTMISRVKNAFGQAVISAISHIQSLYKGNKGSEIETEETAKIRKLVES